ncbi:ribulose-phosphate 3-epimerase [Sporolactobacillus terrae]|uniref:Ribulose-phosphate 3-epimerase n=1 Tax=Sporolactobacillus terrae TaxID=269673 RepID=A0A5K7WZ33_9BACL|nr:ribulose-phosphate 3-epimerase [Sporolactobacillus terrae]BBN97888.1 ribulose-phosphate 3-epimerase [Sporolactobacillus terrae]
MSNTIYPSILDATPDKMMSLLDTFKKTNIHGLHIDMMDGHYVPGIGLNDRLLSWLHANTDFFLDAHLMVTQPEILLDTVIKAGASSVTVHSDAQGDLFYIAQQLNDADVQVGVALSPARSVSSIVPILPHLDRVLVMTTSPGRRTSRFLFGMTEKVKALHNIRQEHDLQFKIEIDGGITDQTLRKLKEASAPIDEYVSGGYIVQAENPEQNILSLLGA